MVEITVVGAVLMVDVMMTGGSVTITELERTGAELTTGTAAGVVLIVGIERMREEQLRGTCG